MFAFHTPLIVNQVNAESIQLLNTAVIRSKEKIIDNSYEERLSKTCSSPAIGAICVAITHLSETESLSRDEAAICIVETIRELDHVWNDYVLMEGITKLKELLKSSQHPHPHPNPREGIS